MRKNQVKASIIRLERKKERKQDKKVTNKPKDERNTHTNNQNV